MLHPSYIALLDPYCASYWLLHPIPFNSTRHHAFPFVQVTGQGDLMPHTSNSASSFHAVQVAFLMHAMLVDEVHRVGRGWQVLALRHTKEAELLPAPAVIGQSVILSDQLPVASIRHCTFR